jgi:competence protein ComEC
VLEKPKLFLNAKEFWLTMLVLLVLLVVRLFFLHQSYQAFKAQPFFYTDVHVIQAYAKRGKRGDYTILKVYAPVLDLSFFTRTKRAVEDLSSHLRLKLFPHDNMRFVDYLRTSFIFSSMNQIYEEQPTLKSKLLHLVEAQHENKMVSAFYKAIYFATPLDKRLRTQVSALGVSHLIALSGYHLAILSALLFWLLRPIYRVFQQRYFPYRFDVYDVGFVVLLILAGYVWLVDAPASLLRSFAMMAVGWVLLVLGMELLSFTFLVTIVLVLLVIFPKMLLSLAFWFSVAGVFYIFLLLKHFSNLNKYLMTLFISFGIFVLMLPIVHMVFPLVSSLQLGSAFLSLVFSIFYPLSMLLHLVGLGDWFDAWLLKLFTLKNNDYMFLLNHWYGMGYVGLSMLAIYSKKIFYLLFLTALAFTVWLFMGFWV